MEFSVVELHCPDVLLAALHGLALAVALNLLTDGRSGDGDGDGEHDEKKHDPDEDVTLFGWPAAD